MSDNFLDELYVEGHQFTISLKVGEDNSELKKLIYDMLNAKATVAGCEVISVGFKDSVEEYDRKLTAAADVIRELWADDKGQDLFRQYGADEFNSMPRNDIGEILKKAKAKV